MVYVPPVYPTGIPTTADLPDRVDDVDWLSAARYNELKDELRAIATELGTLPKGAYADVKTRLDDGVKRFVDRGDPAAYDKAVGDLTTDGTWIDWDVSAIVPAGATAVLIMGMLEGAGVDWAITFRKKGNTNEINHEKFETIRAGVLRHRSGVAIISTARVLQYNADNVAWDTLSLVIRGWWI